MSFKSNWKQFSQKKLNLIILAATFLILIIVLNLFARFLLYVEVRHGVVLPDLLFKLFAAQDFNTPIFILIYGSLITGLISLIPHPKYLLLALQTYIIMVLFRFVAMSLMPLEVPEGIIYIGNRSDNYKRSVLFRSHCFINDFVLDCNK